MNSGLKSFGKIMLTVFIIVYALIAVFATLCLLQFNDKRVTVFGNKSLLILKENLDEDYQKGDLLVVTKGNGSEVGAGDKIFFYNSGQNYMVNYSTVVNAYDVNGDYVFQVDAQYNVYMDYYIGKKVQSFKGMGTLLGFIESKWGFLLLVVLPTLVAVIYEIYVIVLEIIDIKKEVDNE
jgi:hypothetical protein